MLSCAASSQIQELTQFRLTLLSLKTKFLPRLSCLSPMVPLNFPSCLT